MRRSNPINRLIALTCMLVMVATALIDGSVLCIGADGHVEIESAARDCCAPPTNAVAFTDAPCVGCVDVAIEVSAARASTQRDAAVSAPAPASIAALPAPGPLMTASLLAAGPMRRPPSAPVALARLHGVLLRC